MIAHSLQKPEGPRKQEEEDGWMETNLMQVTFDVFFFHFKGYVRYGMLKLEAMAEWAAELLSELRTWEASPSCKGLRV